MKRPNREDYPYNLTSMEMYADDMDKYSDFLEKKVQNLETAMTFQKELIHQKDISFENQRDKIAKVIRDIDLEYPFNHKNQNL